MAHDAAQRRDGHAAEGASAAIAGLACPRRHDGGGELGALDQCPACPGEQLAPVAPWRIGGALISGAGRCPCCSAVWRLGATWAECYTPGLLAAELPEGGAEAR